MESHTNRLGRVSLRAMRGMFGPRRIRKTHIAMGSYTLPRQGLDLLRHLIVIHFDARAQDIRATPLRRVATPPLTLRFSRRINNR